MPLKTGKISELIDHLEIQYKTNIKNINPEIKLDLLCESLRLDYNTFDNIISDNSPVYRTIKGHVFETFFDHFMFMNNIPIKVVGGDDDIDRIVNGNTLQLKTPTEAGTSGFTVQYKTHKTHGAKSEKESFSYYHNVSDFADFLIGLITYNPLRILILQKNELPTHPLSSLHILSPASFVWNSHIGLNNFSRIGINSNLKFPSFNEKDYQLLPKCSQKLGLPSSYIIDSILDKSNFRIWDMSIRGFARESIFLSLLNLHHIQCFKPESIRKERGDKADIALLINKGYIFIQMKGISTNNCDFNSSDPIIAVETQLTRGRVNDHPTQSRLYLFSDFDFLVIGLDPIISNTCKKSISSKESFDWEFFIIPTCHLEPHHIFSNRLKSLQKFKYRSLISYNVNNSGWFS